MSNLNVRNCAMCNKMFKYKGSPLCPSCIQKADDAYVTVRDYLYENPHAGIAEVNEGTEVDEKLILHLIRSGRVTFSADADTGIHCSSCGRPIARGTLCDRCAKQMSDTLKSVLPKQKEGGTPASSKTRGVRMHTADRRETDD